MNDTKPDDIQLPMVLHPKRRTIWLCLSISILFLGGSVLLIPTEGAKAYACLAFSIIMTMVFAIQLLPQASYLVIEEDSFTYCSLFRHHTTFWHEIESWGVTVIAGNQMVGWNYLPEIVEGKKMPFLSQSIGGYHAALPDTYGMSAMDLAAMMGHLHHRHLQRVAEEA